MQATTNQKLRLGILASYGGHDLGARSGVDDISHSW